MTAKPESVEGVVFGDTRLPERFWNKAEVSPSGCWLWRGSHDPLGYGFIHYEGKMRRTHRVAYMALVGPIHADTLDHQCNTPACMNPSHLKQASFRENILRGNSASARNARKTTCPKGHPLSGSNLSVWADGGRVCKTCNRARHIPKPRQAQANARWLVHRGTRKTEMEWAAILGIPQSTIRYRWKRNRDIETGVEAAIKDAAERVTK